MLYEMKKIEMLYEMKIAKWREAPEKMDINGAKRLFRRYFSLFYVIEIYFSPATYKMSVFGSKQVPIHSNHPRRGSEKK